MITDISRKARKLKQMITAAGSIAIIGHVRPDGDCIGSTTGLYNYITENFKNKTVDVYTESFPSSSIPIIGLILSALLSNLS